MLSPIIFLIDGVDYVRKKSMHALNTFILKNVLCVCIVLSNVVATSQCRYLHLN